MADDNRMNTREILNDLPLFADVAPVQLETLAQGCRKLRLEKGQILVRAGSMATAMHCLVAGQVKRTTAPCGSNEKVLDLLYPGQSFGEAEILAGKPYASFAVAIEPSFLLAIDAVRLREAMRLDAQLTGRLLAALAQRQLDMETDIIASRSLSGSQRILDYLMLQAGGLTGARGETQLVLPTSKQLIASRLGLTPETLSRGLRELADAGLIVVDGKHVVLQNAPITRTVAGAADRLAALPNAARLAWGTPVRDEQEGGNGQGAGSGVDLSARPSRALHAAINKAGRLRMLSQRMAKSWLMLGRNVLPLRARTILTQSIELFDKQLMELAAQPVSREVHQAQAAVLDVWRPYKELLESAPAPSGARQLFKLNEQVLLATHGLTQAFEQAADTPESQLINLAGRERMLSQRMAKFYMFLEWEQSGINSAKCHAELRSSMREFETGLTLLADEVRDQPQVRAQLDLVAQQWRQMRSALALDDDENISHIEHPGNPGSPEHPGHLTATVCTFSERLLKKMDAAIALYEKKLAA